MLTREPFREQAEQVSHAATYAHSQPLGSAMRRAGVELFTYYSARKPLGVNVGLFCAEPLRQNRPILGKERHWSVYVSAQTIEFQRVSLQRRRKELHVFKKEDFYVGDEFPAIF